LIIAVIALGRPVLADDTPAPPPTDATAAPADAPPAAPGPNIATQTQAAATGPSPITLRLQYTGELGYNAVGGIHQGTTYLNQLLAQLHVDTDKAFGWTGGSFVLEGNSSVQRRIPV
jgi:porin